MDKVINNMLPNMYPCDYYSAEHFIVGLLEEMRWFLIDNKELYQQCIDEVKLNILPDRD